MHRTKVALIAHRRPEYLLQVAESLVNCDGFNLIDEVVISHDDANATGVPCSELIELLPEMFAPIPTRTIKQPKCRGIVGNTALAMKACFDTEADSVLMLEDDGVLSPDALRLVDWFMFAGDAGTLPHSPEQYISFSLSAHGWQKDNPQLVAPQNMIELNLLGCPFAYAVRKEMWPFIHKNWCIKEYHPCGWSWSMTYAARFAGLISVSPTLSRVRNIGRELGVNESPVSWDLSQGPKTSLTYSDGSFSKEFNFVKILDDKEAHEISEWMLPELARAEGAHYKGWLEFERPPEFDAGYYDGR